jgi:hypothetical protein
MMVSVHDMGDGVGDDMCGRVVIPQIEAGKPVDQWLMLQVCVCVCVCVCVEKEVMYACMYVYVCMYVCMHACL